MATYNVTSTVTVTDGAGVVVPGFCAKEEWVGLTKEEVLRIESVMAGYLKGLAKAAEMRLKGKIVVPEDNGPQDFVASTECVITKDGKEWAATTFRLPNQNTVYLVTMANLYAQAINRIPKKINAKMTATKGGAK